MQINNHLSGNEHIGWFAVISKSEIGQYFIDGLKYNLEVEFRPNFTKTESKFIYEDSQIVILLDGILFDVDKSYRKTDYIELVKTLWNKYDTNFPLMLKGSFSGFILDKLQNRFIVFGDHISSRAIFYNSVNGNFIVSSDVTKIYDYRIKSGIKNILDVNSAYSLLSYGFMQGDATLCEGVKKLVLGNTIEFGRNLKVNAFYTLDNTPNNNLKEDQIINEMDVLFVKAVNRQYDRALGGGITALSAGLDSRMTSLVAHKIGFVNQTNFTFSQSGYFDEFIPKQISSDYNHDWIYKSLDTGNYLKDVDVITEHSGGNVLYYGVAHGYSLLKLLDMSQFDMFHTGLWGDAVIGTYYFSNNPNAEYKVSSGSFSRGGLTDKVTIPNTYPNEEIGVFYNRGFNAILYAGHLMCQQKIETYSPFFDRDLLDYCLKIPVKYRFDHQIYIKWIKTKYPEFVKYKWEKIKARIDTPMVKIKGHNIPVKNVPYLTYNKIKNIITHNSNGAMATKFHMNPMAYHIKNNSSVADFINNYTRDGIAFLNNSELRKDIESLIANDNAINKVQILSLLSAVKRFRFE
jgi:asparagine synthase (glutamine-hydrolysing)